ncbi:MAG: holin [Ruminococcaceae bacterium]|nr:holin [Oscillospiraceae bacterium]
MKERLASPVLWLAVAALFTFVMKNWVGWEIPKFDEFVELLLAVLIAFGVVNNPTDQENF